MTTFEYLSVFLSTTRSSSPGISRVWLPIYLPAIGLIVTGHAIAACTGNRRFHQVWVIANVLAFASLGLGIWADVFSSG